MKHKLVLAIAGIIAVVFLLWWFKRNPQGIAPQIPATNLSSSLQAGSNGTVAGTFQNQQAQPPHTAGDKSTIPGAVVEYIKKVRLDPTYDWKQPINFYGRVVDESNAVVSGASVHFTWNDLSPKGTSDANTVSDGNGGFSLADQRGKRLYVEVSKNGYYSSGNSQGAAFEYANPGDGLFTPDSGNPVVFHLRKKGVGVDLITSQSGIITDFPIHIPRDGTPVKVDFIHRSSGDQGQMQITEFKPDFKDWKQATNWLFRVVIPDGGFVEENDEFPFEAPENGYQPALEFNFQKGQADWATDIHKDYYIKFGNPPLYGRLHIETGIDYGGATLKYAINPDGSRNLEPK